METALAPASIALDGALSPLQIAAQCKVEPFIYDDVLPELCAPLEAAILQQMQQSRRATPSLNVGGWKSGEDFFRWPVEAVQTLRDHTAQLLGLTKGTMGRLVGWAMVNRAGSHHPRHQHNSAILVGVYYVSSGSEDAITPTIFECNDGQKYDLEVEPHPARLVICRGDCWHRVPPYPGDKPRITIAFDVRR